MIQRFFLNYLITAGAIKLPPNIRIQIATQSGPL